MEIDSNSRYLNALEYQSLLQASQTRQTNTSTDSTSNSTDTEGYDYYESTLADTTSALKSEAYNNIMDLIKANKQASGITEPEAPTEEDFKEALEEILASLEETTESSSTSDTTDIDEALATITTDTEDSTTSETTSSSATTESSSSSDSSDSTEDDTTTEIVRMPDGSIFLKTTTTDEDGNETVTMTKIMDAQNPMQAPKKPDNTNSSETDPSQTQSSAYENEQSNIMGMDFNGMVPPMLPPYDESLTSNDEVVETEESLETA